MALRPDLQPDNAGGAGPRPTAGPREIEAGGQCGAPSAAGRRLGIGSGGALAPDALQSPVMSLQSLGYCALCRLCAPESRSGCREEFATLRVPAGSPVFILGIFSAVRWNDWRWR